MREEKNLQISVIIPVYNAASYVTQAVESALAEPETAEVLLVEDGSPDNSLAICQALSDRYDKVRLLRHPGGVNKGAGASRNLGMKNALFDFIAFLDADDFYLPGRFKKTREVFEENPDCDGVYEAIGMHVENEAGKERWDDAGRPERSLHTLRISVSPDELSEVLILGRHGTFSINGLVIKKKVLVKTGYMVESLRLHQDSDFIYKLAIAARLYPGKLDEPVAMWRIHDKNRISTPRNPSEIYKDRIQFLMTTYRWSKDHKEKKGQKILFAKMIGSVLNMKHTDNSKFDKCPSAILRRVRLCRWFFEYPEVILEPLFWKKFFSLRRSEVVR